MKIVKPNESKGDDSGAYIELSPVSVCVTCLVLGLTSALSHNYVVSGMQKIVGKVKTARSNLGV